MAISSFPFTSRFYLRSNHFFHCVRKLCRSSVVAIESFDEAEESSKFEASNNSVHEKGDSKVRKWKKLNSKDLGISTSMIPNPTRKVLNGLKQKGYDVYLVGGCVRDLVLNRTPKDFDIITSAELREVKKVFPWCELVGRKFPICHVHVNDTILEVSSFTTSRHRFDDDSSNLSEIPTGFDESDYGRWRNCLHRDFTINGFMFDPYESIIYDYVGGIEDLKKARIRTIIPADVSFREDSARILRGLRIAARLGFRISKETAHCIKHYSGSVLSLGKGRLLMEVNYMLAFGSAEASIRLLWKFGLLELLLPVQAAYFADTGFRRRDERTNMLLSLFSNMDKLLLPDKPCHGSLWVAILAFHKALYNKPHNPLVVAALSLAVHNGGDISEATEIAGRIVAPHDSSFRELAEPREVGPAELACQVRDLAAGIKSALAGLTDDQVVSRAMSRYSKAPVSDLVIISTGLYLRVCRVFDCVGSGQGLRSKQGSKIDYEALANGSLEEVRHVFARIVFDTVYPLKLTAKQ